MGAGTVGALVSQRLEQQGSEVVCLVDVKPSSKPVYAKTIKGDNCFYVRATNSTRLLDGPELVDYISEHWK